MENKEYVSVKEFAKRAGISKQAVYKRISQTENNQFSQYLKEIDNKKYIKLQALELIPSSIKLNDNLSDILSVFKEQLQEKDLQIKELNIRLSELNQRLAEANELNRNNQVLIGNIQKQQKILVDIIKETLLKKRKTHFWNKFF